MKKRLRVYAKFNLLSLFLVAVSFISITLAWFAYSGIAGVGTEIDVQAWQIEFKKDSNVVTNDIVISLSDIYPGMETVSEKVEIHNMGDSNAQISYSIQSARILDNEYANVDADILEDKLSHDFPFHLNIGLSKDFVLAKGDSSQIEVSVSWPLDAGDDELDSDWGNAAFECQSEENKKTEENPDYHMRSTLQVVISVKAEQYMTTNEATDMNFSLGNMILYDIQKNEVCSQLGNGCVKTHVIDVDNKVGDTTVRLLPDLFSTYGSGNFDEYTSVFDTITADWGVEVNPLTVEDVTKIISQDVTGSFLIRDNFSDDIIGNIKYNDRLNTELNKLISSNGYYTFMNEKFNYLVTSKCYWLNSEYNDGAFALVKMDDQRSKVYKEDRATVCEVVPVITVAKASLLV